MQQGRGTTQRTFRFDGGASERGFRDVGIEGRAEELAGVDGADGVGHDLVIRRENFRRAQTEAERSGQLLAPREKARRDEPMSDDLEEPRRRRLLVLVLVRIVRGDEDDLDVGIEIFARLESLDLSDDARRVVRVLVERDGEEGSASELDAVRIDSVLRSKRGYKDRNGGKKD